MICKKCGYNDKKPLGKALEDIPAGKKGLIQLNINGMRWLIHKKECDMNGSAKIK